MNPWPMSCSRISPNGVQDEKRAETSVPTLFVEPTSGFEPLTC